MSNLDTYLDFYISDTDHWYISKVKQITNDSLVEMSKGLGVFWDLLSSRPNEDSFKRYQDFIKTEQKQLDMLKCFTYLCK